MSEKWTLAQMGSQAGKRFYITGANSGVGYSTAVELARAGGSGGDGVPGPGARGGGAEEAEGRRGGGRNLRQIGRSWWSWTWLRWTR